METRQQRTWRLNVFSKIIYAWIVCGSQGISKLSHFSCFVSTAKGQRKDKNPEEMNRLRDQLVSTFKEQMDIRLEMEIFHEIAGRAEDVCTLCGPILGDSNSVGFLSVLVISIAVPVQYRFVTVCILSSL